MSEPEAEKKIRVEGAGDNRVRKRQVRQRRSGGIFLPEKDTPQAWEAAARHGLSVIELESDEDRQVAARWRQDVVNAQELFSLSSISRARLADLRKLHDGKRQHQASDNSTADTKLERVQGKCMRLSIRTRDKT